MIPKKKSSLLVKYLNLYKQKPTSKVFAPLAESYRKLGMIEDALRVLADGLNYHPGYVLAHLVLANCYFDQKRYQKCYEVLKPFVNEHIDNISLQRLFAECCLKNGQLQEALQTYKYLLFINPRDTHVSRRVKALEDDLEVTSPVITEDISYKEAQPEDWVQVNFNKKVIEPSVEEVESSNTDSWQIESSQIKNVFKTQQSEIKEATKQSLPDSKKSPVVTHTLVDLYCAQEHYDKAIEVLERILDLNPEDQRTQKKLVEVKALIERKSYEESEHEKLLNYIETKVQKPDTTYLELAGKFDLFLKALRGKASTV